MKQNRKNCAAIYCDEEYEKLVLEAYWQAKAETKMANNRYRFTCIHCKESHKDKSTLSYHRMFNLCKGYMGEQPLKMYPTWEPSDHKEKARIAAKYGKVSSPTASQFPSLVVFPPPLELDAVPVCSTTFAIIPAEQHYSRKRKVQNSVLSMKAPLHSKSPPSSKCQLKVKKQPPRRVIISSSEEDLDLASSCSESESTTKEATPNSQKNGHVEFCVMKHDHVLCAQSLYKYDLHAQDPHEHVLCAQDLHKPVVHAENLERHFLYAQDSHEHVLHAQPSHEDVSHVQHRPLSREDCKQQAHEEATTLFNAHNEIINPPDVVPVHGLYILIMETDEQWMPKELLDDPDACMQYLHKQLEDGTIGQHIGTAFGQWYLYGNAQVFDHMPCSSVSQGCSMLLYFYSTRVFYYSACLLKT
jgi:hypothetical protein